MRKTVKINSAFLRPLTEAIQKLQITGVITEASPITTDKNGNFSSVLKTQDEFDPSQLGSNVFLDDEEEQTTDTASKEQLINQAAEAIKQSLTASEDLNSILKKMKELSKDTNYNQWQINEEGNTATLKSKDARIFKQNDKLCLSHGGKVELFNNVSELHKWLKENKYPLPGNIEIHESTLAPVPLRRFQNQGSRHWWDLYKKHQEEQKQKRIDAENKSKEEVPQEESLEEADIFSKIRNKFGKDTLVCEEDPKDPTTRQEALELQKDEITAKKGSDEEKEQYANLVYGCDGGWGAVPTRLMTEEFVLYVLKNFPWAYVLLPDHYKTENINNFMLKIRPDLVQGTQAQILQDLWYKTFHTDNAYFILDTTPDMWIYYSLDGKNLIYGNCQRGDWTAFGWGRDIALGSVAYNEKEDLRTQVKQLADTLRNKNKETSKEECVGATTSTGLGAATTWTGNKKEEATTSLQETVYGLKGTPFANNVYSNIGANGQRTNAKIARANEYIDWLTTDDNIKNINKDAFLELEKDIIGKMVVDGGYAIWKGMFPEKILIDPAACKKRVEEVNAKYGLNLDYTKPIRSLSKFKIVQHPDNTQEYLKWRNDFYHSHKTELLTKGGGPRAAKLLKIHEYLNNLKNDTANTSTSTTSDDSDLANSMINKYNSVDKIEFLNLLMNLKKKVSEEEFNTVINALIKAHDEKQIDSTDFEKANWNFMRTQTESVLTEAKINSNSRFAKLIGTVLKEEDSPADFAAGIPSTSDITSTASTSPSTNPSTDTDIPDFDLGGSEGSDMPEFGDINISGGSGYAPDDLNMGDEGESIANTPQYEVIDVLANDDDLSEIKVKLKNIETDEIEIKNLSEIDV